ncbi:phage-related lysozyme [Leptolyngbya sp. Heron Island J]|uniref:glycoside hydrolase family protein n=1 Tax=Leptolyngbya sp. Heron Island J TaxID=1385935 RepID=UPI0003B9C622|nr:D-Ala-D-Ala carboxypeptidase family metallohydrolase [Leptolyngbya sp. Heron Island J]ESA37240.1 phage-related lysozyme [Leptolyngbya sp. Heron Island J]
MAAIPDAAIDLIKKFEGLRLDAYPDPGSADGLPITIGYGSTRKQNGSPFKLGESLTQAEAEALLSWDLENRFLPPQTKIPTWDTMDDDQRGAILSFAYNLGAAFYGNSGFQTITRVLKDAAWDEIEAALVLYRNPNTNVEAGLLKRRLAEAEVFLTSESNLYVSSPGQQFLKGVLSKPQSYFTGLKGPFSPGQRTVSLTQPFMFGDDIKVMQQSMVDKGFKLTADGFFGTITEGIVKDFQKANELQADGVVGPGTWKSLLDTPEPPDNTDPDAEPPGPVTRLMIKQDTVLKLRPEETLQLSDAEKEPVQAGDSYSLHSYAYADPIAGDFNGHIKVALKETTIRGLNTWFIEGQYVQVEIDDEVVYPWEEQQTVFQLRVYRDTIFKQRPMPSSELPDTEKVEVKKETNFILHSYAYQDSHGDFSSHIKISIKDPKDFLKGLSQWYVYDRHSYVEYDENIVYPPTPILNFTQNTIIKRRPLQSSELPTEEKASIPSGNSFILDSWAYKDEQGKSFNGHIKFALKLESDFISSFSTWYVYDQHAQVTWNGKVLYPPFAGKSFRLPGKEGLFYTQQPIFTDSNFTWGEATKNGTRIPTTPEIVDNIITFARALQNARNIIGQPFVINSWYRDPQSNEAVGGATNSQHLSGRAVDMYVPGVSVRQVANALRSSWPGGILIYSSHLHLDTGRKQIVFL